MILFIGKITVEFKTILKIFRVFTNRLKNNGSFKKDHIEF